MADNKRRGRFGRGSDEGASQSIFDLFEPPPDQDGSSLTRIPIIRDGEALDLTGVEVSEGQASSEAEAAGLAHWTEPPTGQIPASLAASVSQDDRWADVRGPSWQGEEPNWAGPDLSDVFADTAAISHHRVVEEDLDDLVIDPPPPPAPSRRAPRADQGPAVPSFDAQPPPPAPSGGRGPGRAAPPSAFDDLVPGAPPARPPAPRLRPEAPPRVSPPPPDSPRRAVADGPPRRIADATGEHRLGPGGLPEAPGLSDQTSRMSVAPGIERPVPQSPAPAPTRMPGARPPGDARAEERRLLGDPSAGESRLLGGEPRAEQARPAVDPRAGEPRLLGREPRAERPGPAIDPRAGDRRPGEGRPVDPRAGDPRLLADGAGDPRLTEGPRGPQAAAPTIDAPRGGVRLDDGQPPAIRRGAHDMPPSAFDEPPGPGPDRVSPAPRPAARQSPRLDDMAFAADDGDGPAARQAHLDRPPIDEHDDYDDYDDGYGEERVRDRALSQRVAVGVGLAAVVLIALGLGPDVTMGLVAVVVLLAVVELFHTMRVAGLRPATLLGLVGAVALPAATYARGEAGFPLVAGLAVVFGMLWYLTGADTERPVLNLGLTFMGVMWIGGLAGFAALILRAEGGVGLLLATIIITSVSDTLAYLGGRAYGTKPFHSASPNKTWEGTLTGLFGALLAGLILGLTNAIGMFDGNLTAMMALALVVGILAPIGDLSESLVKRDLGAKDMGNLLPGHGGILDRVDGLLFALPGAYYLAVIFGLL